MLAQTPRAWSFALLVLVGGLLAWAGHRGRQWNFDCIGYAVAAEHWRGADEKEAHARVYAALAASAPAAEFKTLSESSGYRTGLFTDPAQLGSQIGFYANKPLLVVLAAGLASVGVNVIEALFWLACLAYALFGMVFVHGCVTRIGAWGWWGALTLLTPPLLETGQLATPDSLAALFLLLGARVVLETPRLSLAAVFFAIAGVARPDALVLSVPLLVWHGAAHGRWRQVAGVSFALVVLQQVSGVLTGAHSWSALFVHTFLRRLTSAAALQEAHVTAADYLTVVGRGLRNDFVMHPSMWPLFAALAGVACVQRAARGPMLAVAVSAVVHFALFPMLADRFFLAHEALVLLALLPAVLRPASAVTS